MHHFVKWKTLKIQTVPLIVECLDKENTYVHFMRCLMAIKIVMILKSLRGMLGAGLCYMCHIEIVYLLYFVLSVC